MRRFVAALMMVLAATGAAFGGERQSATTVMSDDPQFRKIEQAWGFSDAIVVDGTIYLSGLVASRKDGDIEAGYREAFERIAAILHKAGASWDDVVDITSFHTDLKTQMPVLVAVKNHYVRDPFPAWTAIQVVRLIPDDGITEFKVVAKLPGKIHHL